MAGPLQVICQIFKPGGFNGNTGTPNYYLDLGNTLVGATWTDAQLGGIQSATFKLKQQYETVLDIVAGNWLVWGCWGGVTPTVYNAGTSSIQVLNAADDLGHPFFALNDSIIISDGVNSEIFKIAALSYSGTQLIIDGGFELGGGTWEVGVTNALFSTNKQDTTAPFSGTYDLLIRLNQSDTVPASSYNAQGYTSNTSTVVAGQTILTSVAMNWSASTTMPAGISGGLNTYIRFINASNGVIQDINVGILSAATVNNAYQVFNNTVIVPTGAVTALMWCEAWVSNQNGTAFTTGAGLYLDARFDAFSMQVINANAIANITFGSAPSQNTSVFLNQLAAGARVVRLLFQGIITGRQRTTQWSNEFSITAMGMMWRYQKVISTFTVTQQDAGLTLLDVCESFANQVPEIIVNPANFVNPSNIPFSGTSKNQNAISLINTILQTEGGGYAPSTPNEASYWSLYVDELRQIHHIRVPTLNYQSPTFTIDLLANNPYGDVLGPLQTSDMDLTRLVNVIVANGATQSDGTVLSIVVTHQQSYQQWGYYEGLFANSAITDQTTLVAWSAGQLGVSAWPQSSARLQMVVASGRFGCRDLIAITGFTDATTLTTNPTTIQYSIASFQQPIVTAMVTLTQEQPNFQSIASEIASQHAVKALQNASFAQLNNSYIVSGCVVSASGLTWTCTAGVIVYNGIAYSAATASGTMTNGQTIYLGFNSISNSFVSMPSFSAGGVIQVAAQNWYELQNTGGSQLAVVQQTNFKGVFIARLTALSGTIYIEETMQAFGGISGSRVVFQNLQTDPTTGQLIIPLNNTAVHPSTQQYQSPAWGSNSVFEFSCYFTILGSGPGFAILVYNTPTGPSPTSAYYGIWDTDGYFRIEKQTPTLYTLATSSSATTLDSRYHDMTLVMKMAGNGIQTVSLVFDGIVMCQATDYGSGGTGVILQQGYLGVQNRNLNAKILIDPVNTYAEITGNQSSAAFSAQGSIVPVGMPGYLITVASPTYGAAPGQRRFAIGFNPNGIQYPDGSNLVYYPNPTNDGVSGPYAGGLWVVNDSSGANGTWYYSIGFNTSTMQPIFFLSQSAPTSTQLLAFLADGIVPISVNNSLTVTAGANTVITNGAGNPSARYLQ